MLIDTGAQISLINKNVIHDPSLIKPQNKVSISSIHGTEDTLGDISAKILTNKKDIPLQLQVTKNIALTEDGILGYDVLGEQAIVDGPNKIVTINSENIKIEFPIKTHPYESRMDQIFNKEIKKLYNIEYLNNIEINKEKMDKLSKVKLITQEINENKIQIGQNKSNQ